jgi:hypothetical protein
MGPHLVEVTEIDCRDEVDEGQPLPSSDDLVEGGMNGFGHHGRAQRATRLLDQVHVQSDRDALAHAQTIG